MSDLERVEKELARLTERLREVKNRKNSAGIPVRQDRPANPPSVTRQRSERPIA